MLYLEVAILAWKYRVGGKAGRYRCGYRRRLWVHNYGFCAGTTPPGGGVPITVMFIIMAIVLALSVVQKAGDIDHMVKLAGIALCKHPKYINFLALLIAFILTVITGTGYSSLSIFKSFKRSPSKTACTPLSR